MLLAMAAPCVKSDIYAVSGQEFKIVMPQSLMRVARIQNLNQMSWV